MGDCCGHGHWGQCGWGYESPVYDPGQGYRYARPPRRGWRPAEGDLEGYVRDLEDQLRAVRADLETLRRTREPAGTA
jgi:hypothetical protein